MTLYSPALQARLKQVVAVSDTCTKCGAQIHDEDGTWVDNSGGDVCGTDGGNDSHTPSMPLDKQATQELDGAQGDLDDLANTDQEPDPTEENEAGPKAAARKVAEGGACDYCGGNGMSPGGTPCPSCGGSGHSGDELGPDVPEYEDLTDEEKQAWRDWAGVPPRDIYASKKESAMTNHREAQILEAMKYASLQEQEVLVQELQQIRSTATRQAAADRDWDAAGEIVADHLTPVLVHGMHSTATDWLDDAAPEYHTADLKNISDDMRAEASVWMTRVSPEVRADRLELIAQASGVASRLSGQYGEMTQVAKDQFMNHVAHLIRTADATDMAGVPSAASPVGDPNPEAADWSDAPAPTGPPADIGSYTAPPGLDALPSSATQDPTTDGDSGATSAPALPAEDTFDTSTNAATGGAPAPVDPTTAVRRAAHQIFAVEEGQAFPVPGEVDVEQSGEAGSSLPVGVDVAGHPESFDNFMPDTPAAAAPSTRAPNVQGARRTAADDAAPTPEDGERFGREQAQAGRPKRINVRDTPEWYAAYERGYDSVGKQSSRRTAVETGPNPQGSTQYDASVVEGQGYEEGFHYALLWTPGKPVPAAATSAAILGHKYNAEYVTGYQKGLVEGVATLDAATQTAWTAALKSAQVLASLPQLELSDMDDSVSNPLTWTSTSPAPVAPPGAGTGAADVAGVPTPGQAPADYPQPTASGDGEPSVAGGAEPVEDWLTKAEASFRKGR